MRRETATPPRPYSTEAGRPPARPASGARAARLPARTRQSESIGPPVATLFLVCAVVGGGILLLQLLLSLFGLGDHDVLGFHLDGSVGDALELLSLRVLAAAAAFFGFAGMVVQQRGGGDGAALAAGLLCGAAAGGGVAAVMRAMKRAESDGAVVLERAVGQAGVVYLSIPGGPGQPGKVHLTLQSRTVECRAVAERSLPTGAQVVVVGVVGPDLVEVVPQPSLESL
jgi:hypothetical protein